MAQKGVMASSPGERLLHLTCTSNDDHIIHRLVVHVS